MSEPEDHAAAIRALPDGWVRAMGIEITKATVDEVVAEWTVDDQHRQPYGIVHGGVHCGVVETLASIGAALVAMPRGQSVVGLDNNTSFLHAVRSGRLRAVAKPLSRGRKTQIWQVDVSDESTRIVATGRVRLLCLDGDAMVAGGGVKAT
jgi:1,4-dihydroxy-2-naphthoyl-CoA hydrolase